ncbi:hypothetical protein [Streptomyces sp. Go-475]|uniref:hypothetical protein n=1 Tax=Streptomyces sp. Go-475 TaxID=2072505 RepID=UPI000DF0C24C|nr:hypothetical protein [Streptomyces sp. Go-475]AXE85715.1 hypothetical protein C1703_11940 [Streptomyces sp. Go-475]
MILPDEGREQSQRMRAEVAAAEARLLAELSEEQRARFRDLPTRVALTAQRGTVND